MSKIVQRKQSSIWTNATRKRGANSRPILARYIGLECEYSIRLRGQPQRPPTILDFTRLLVCLEQVTPIAPSISNPLRFYLANGGAVSLETGNHADMNHALIESATPECTSPTDLLTYQIANERLLSAALQRVYATREASLIKATCDAHGHTYGQHESYDMEIANGWRLVGWRIGLLLLIPFVLIYRLLATLWFFFIWLLSSTERLVVQSFQLVKNARKNSPKAKPAPPKGDEQTNYPDALAEEKVNKENHQRAKTWRSDASLQATPVRWLLICAWGLRRLHLPVLWAFSLNLWLFALRPHRRYLGAFFASRCILDGAGHVDRDNQFWLSHRASTVDRMIGYGSYGPERPIFRCDAMLKDLFAGSPWSLFRFIRLFRRRQRVEIAIGDSGLCHQSQFLRFGVTSLAIDLVERNSARDMPRLKDPLEAMQRFAKDWMLLNTVSDTKNRAWTAIELQQRYAAGVRSLLQRCNDVPVEAWRILDCWQTTLNQLVLGDDGDTLPRHMLGRIDWINKLWLLQQMDAKTPWEIRKKIDIRYHELSPSGYQQRFEELLQVAPLARELEIEKAQRVPPSKSPATRRGYMIREFAGGDADLSVDWECASYQLDSQKYRVRFSGDE